MLTGDLGTGYIGIWERYQIIQRPQTQSDLRMLHQVSDVGYWDEKRLVIPLNWLKIDGKALILRIANSQVVILGTGKKALEKEVHALDKSYPDTIKGVVKFSSPLAHLITAGGYLLVYVWFKTGGNSQTPTQY